MVQRVYEQAKKAFDNVCVATDDSRIFNKVKEFGGEAVMTSSEHNSGTDRCMEAYDTYLSEHKCPPFDLIINVQGDEPLIESEQLLSLETLFNDPQVQIGTISKHVTSPSELFNCNNPKLVVDKNGYALYFSRNVIPFVRDYKESDWLESFHFLKHIGLYAYRPDTLREICNLSTSSLENSERLEQLRWLENGMKIKVVETKFETHSIDTPADLEKLIEYIKKK